MAGLFLKGFVFNVRVDEEIAQGQVIVNGGIAVVDQEFSMLQIRFPRKEVRFDGRAVPERDGLVQSGPIVDEAQEGDGYHVWIRHVEQDVRDDADAQIRNVSHGAGSDKRQHQIGALLHPPHTKGLSEIFIMGFEPKRRGHVPNSQESERRVHEKPAQVIESLGSLSLEEVIQDDVGVYHVIEEIGDAVPDGLWGVSDVGIGRWFCDGAVDDVIDPVNPSIDGFEWIVIRPLGTGGRRRGASGQHGEYQPADGHTQHGGIRVRLAGGLRHASHQAAGNS